MMLQQPTRLLVLMLLALARIHGAFIAGSGRQGLKRPRRFGSSKAFASSGDSSTTQISTSLADSLLLQPAVPFGGDFCGLQAQFTKQGQLIPIPEYWIPKELVEWGQEPSSLEVLFSEQPDSNALQRHVTTILPATGCAVDNQEVVQRVEDCVVVMEHLTDSSRSLLLQTAVDKQQHSLEVSFGLEDNHRIRVYIPIIDASRSVDRVTADHESLQISEPIAIDLERQVSTKSSQGTVAKGGGLDGQKVARMRGPWLSARLDFAAQRPKTEAATAGGDKQLTTVILPGNITIASKTTEDDKLEISVTHSIKSESDDTTICRGIRAILEGSETGVACRIVAE